MLTRIHRNFERIALRRQKSYKCACGRRVRRSKTVEQTLNPFNKLADGRVKNWTDIRYELRSELDAWQRQAEPCTHAAAPMEPEA